MRKSALYASLLSISGDKKIFLDIHLSVSWKEIWAAFKKSRYTRKQKDFPDGQPDSTSRAKRSRQWAKNILKLSPPPIHTIAGECQTDEEVLLFVLGEPYWAERYFLSNQDWRWSVSCIFWAKHGDSPECWSGIRFCFGVINWVPASEDDANCAIWSSPPGCALAFSDFLCLNADLCKEHGSESLGSRSAV